LTILKKKNLRILPRKWSVATMGELIPKTLRIPIIIGRKNLVALIESGSSHKFINPKVSQECNLPTRKAGHLRVKTMSGARAIPPLECKDLNFTMGTL